MGEIDGEHQLTVGKWAGCPVGALDAEGIFVSFWFAKLGSVDREAIVAEIRRRNSQRAAKRRRNRERNRRDGLPEA